MVGTDTFYSELAEKCKNNPKVVNFGIDIKTWEDWKTFEDVWSVLPDGCVVLLQGRDFVTEDKADVYWQEVKRRALKAPRAKYVFHCVYRQNKEDFWIVIVKKERQVDEGGVVEVRPGSMTFKKEDEE